MWETKNQKKEPESEHRENDKVIKVDSGLGADHESVEVVEPTEITEESSEEVKIGTCAELSADDGDDEDDSTKITVSVVTWNLAEASPSEDEAKFIRRFRKAHPALSSRDGRRNWYRTQRSFCPGSVTL